MRCAACGHANRSGRKFCAQCGTPLAVACPACGAANEPGERFCGECGAPLEVAVQGSAPVPSVERRLVSVLFADLVGFTPLSESRDAEEVRGLLSRYFETARTVIGRYGGTVEKFIGDAVMAVWGAPTAQEDDAERAVRAALELVDAVAALGGGLAARAEVLTGEAAVTVGAEGQGMVAGDLVNTASRVQSVAEAGTVLVGDATRRASEAAIAYRDAGGFELKGKAGAQRLMACAARRGRPPRRDARGGPRAAVRRPRSGAAAGEGALPRLSRAGEGAPALGARHRRHQQVAPRLGAGEVPRRADSARVLASRPLPRLRRGRYLLGARGDAARPRPHRRRGGARLCARATTCWSGRATTRSSSWRSRGQT
jgi:class 3 adenylate cyclase